MPTNPTVAGDPEIQAVWANDSAGQWLATAYAQYANVDLDALGPAVGPFREVRTILNESLDELILGDGDPATILADAEAAVTEAIKAYNDANF